MSGALVLIADDSKLFLEMQKRLLVPAGFEVLAVDTCGKAIEAAGRRPPNLVLLDFNMPDQDGATACGAMRREPRLAQTPIIIMSATTTEEIRERCLQSGCTEFVSKPEKSDELLGMVARILATRRRRATRLTVIFRVEGGAPDSQKIGRAADLSSTGLLLVGLIPFEVGMVLNLEFVVPKNHHIVNPRGRVMRTRRDPEGNFEAGIHFIDIQQGDQEAILDYVTG
jgi:CheY-like chemotaxis protein